MKWMTGITVFMASMVVGYCLTCNESSDCNEGECCVAATINQIRGSGVCRSLARLGRPCNMEGITLENYGEKYLSKCPCRSGYSCEASARYRDGNGNKLFADLSQRCRRSSTTRTTRVSPTTITSETSEISNEISTDRTSTVTVSSTTI